MANYSSIHGNFAKRPMLIVFLSMKISYLLLAIMFDAYCLAKQVSLHSLFDKVYLKTGRDRCHSHRTRTHTVRNLYAWISIYTGILHQLTEGGGSQSGSLYVFIWYVREEVVCLCVCVCAREKELWETLPRARVWQHGSGSPLFVQWLSRNMAGIREEQATHKADGAESGCSWETEHTHRHICIYIYVFIIY